MIVMEDEVEAFLEHHGVKGMHWGVRNVNSLNDRSGKFIKRNKKKIVIGVGVGVTVIGAALAVTILKNKSSVKVSNLKPISDLNSLNEGVKNLYKKGFITDGREDIDKFGRKASPIPSWWNEKTDGSWIFKTHRGKSDSKVFMNEP